MSDDAVCVTDSRGFPLRRRSTAQTAGRAADAQTSVRAHWLPFPPALPSLVLAEWAEGLKRLLGKQVVGLYLSGSLAYGDFVPDRSDIDLQAVVRTSLTEGEVGFVERLHREIEQSYPEWANRVECSYVPLALMRELMPPATPRPWWGFGTFYAEAPVGNEWIINHYLLSKHGICASGT